MTELGIENACFKFIYTTGHTPEAGHACLYVNSSNELRLIAPDATDYEITKSDGWQTFVPTVSLIGGSGNTVPEYTTNSGRYTQMGKIVYADVLLDGDGGNEGAGTGQINVALPVTAGASIINDSSVIPMGNIKNGNTTYSLGGAVLQSATNLKLYYFKKVEEAMPVTGAEQNDADRTLRLHFWYEID